jgi:hypothetical protein
VRGILIAVTLSVAFWCGVFYLAMSTRLPSDTAPIVGTQPTCGDTLALMTGKETVQLVRDGNRMVIEVWYDGFKRGELVTIDINERTAQVPNRPPSGWKIGGR